MSEFKVDSCTWYSLSMDIYFQKQQNTHLEVSNFYKCSLEMYILHLFMEFKLEM